MSLVIAGTGHRPNKLGGYSHQARMKLVTLARGWLEKQEGITKVISGGALGWDQALAEAAQELTIPTLMALPFEGFEAKWPRESQEFLYSLMNPSEVVFVCEPGYAPWKMQVRNQWMVDHCDVVLALWNGSSGGTGNCIQYANKVGRPIVNLWEKYENLD